MTITDNLFLRNGAYAVHLYPYAQRTSVTHNVMVDNGGGVVFAGESGGASSNNTVSQNVITGDWMRPGHPLVLGPGSGHREPRRRQLPVRQPEDERRHLRRRLRRP